MRARRDELSGEPCVADDPRQQHQCRTRQESGGVQRAAGDSARDHQKCGQHERHQNQVRPELGGQAEQDSRERQHTPVVMAVSVRERDDRGRKEYGA